MTQSADGQWVSVDEEASAERDGDGIRSERNDEQRSGSGFELADWVKELPEGPPPEEIPPAVADFAHLLDTSALYTSLLGSFTSDLGRVFANQVRPFTDDLYRPWLGSLTADLSKVFATQLRPFTDNLHTLGLGSIAADSFKLGLGSIAADSFKLGLGSIAADSFKPLIGSIAADSFKLGLGSIAADSFKPLIGSFTADLSKVFANQVRPLTYDLGKLPLRSFTADLSKVFANQVRPLTYDLNKAIASQLWPVLNSSGFLPEQPISIDPAIDISPDTTFASLTRDQQRLILGYLAYVLTWLTCLGILLGMVCSGNVLLAAIITIYVTMTGVSGRSVADAARKTTYGVFDQISPPANGQGE